MNVIKECHTYGLSEVHRTASLLCREGCTGSIFLSVQYEECEDLDAIESTRAKVRSPAPFGPLQSIIGGLHAPTPSTIPGTGSSLPSHN